MIRIQNQNLVNQVGQLAQQLVLLRGLEVGSEIGSEVGSKVGLEVGSKVRSDVGSEVGSLLQRRC